MSRSDVRRHDGEQAQRGRATRRREARQRVADVVAPQALSRARLGTHALGGLPRDGEMALGIEPRVVAIRFAAPEVVGEEDDGGRLGLQCADLVEQRAIQPDDLRGERLHRRIVEKDDVDARSAFGQEGADALRLDAAGAAAHPAVVQRVLRVRERCVHARHEVGKEAGPRLRDRPRGGGAAVAARAIAAAKRRRHRAADRVRPQPGGGRAAQARERGPVAQRGDAERAVVVHGGRGGGARVARQQRVGAQRRHRHKVVTCPPCSNIPSTWTSPIPA
eukprot:4819071-Prymnesium_polylepis.1